MRLFAIIPSVTILFVASLSGGTVSAGDTQVYKTVDVQGNVVYTDKASNTSAQQSTVHYHEPSAEALEQQRKAQQAAETQRLQQAVASGAAQARQQKEQQAKQTRCDDARRYLESLKAARRLYQQDAQGERVFLTDQEADSKRAQASQAMLDACGS